MDENDRFGRWCSRAPESVHQTYLIVRRQRATFYDPNIARACLVPKQPQTAASLQELKNFIGPARSSRGSRYPLDGGLGLEKKAVKAQTGRWRGATRPPQARSEKKAYYRYARCLLLRPRKMARTARLHTHKAKPRGCHAHGEGSDTPPTMPPRKRARSSPGSSSAAAEAPSRTVHGATATVIASHAEKAGELYEAGQALRCGGPLCDWPQQPRRLTRRRTAGRRWPGRVVLSQPAHAPLGSCMSPLE